MQRLLIVYNPRSSRFAEVKQDVLARIRKLQGYIIGKYEVTPTNLDDNIKNLAKILRDGDLVVSAGGDATGIIASNAIIKSKKDVTLAVLPYGNFNDLSRTLRTEKIEDVLGDQERLFDGPPERGSARMSAGRPWRRAGRTQPEKSRFGLLYPLEILIDGKHWRYATCYVTIGMTAKAVSIYDQPKMRAKLKKSFGRKVSSYTDLASWYFKHRRECILPEFKLNGKLQPKKTSDYAAVNGRSMARVMKGGEDYRDPKVFRSETDRLTNSYRLFKLMLKSIFFRIPGSPTKSDILEFVEPSTITLQAEGESDTIKNVQKIEIKKGEICLKVIEN